MKFTAEQKTIATALTKLASVVERRNTIPILSNVAIDATDGQLRLTATDLDCSLTLTLSAEIEEEGCTTVTVGMLTDVVKRMPVEKEVSFSHADGRLTVKSGRKRANIATLPIDDFPNVLNLDFDYTVDIPANLISDTFGKTSFAMSTDEVRYYLNGVYLCQDIGKLICVSTDSHRLAKVETDQEYNFDGVIIPRKAVGIVGKLFSVGNVSMSVSTRGVRFDAGDVTFTSRLIDGKFPDYNRVIPQKTGTVVKVSGAEFKNAVSCVTAVTSEKVRAVKLNVNKDGIVFSVSGSENSAIDEIDAYVEGDDIEIGFNAKYLTEVFSVIGDSDVTVYLNPGSPALFVPDDVSRSEFVVMPMMV